MFKIGFVTLFAFLSIPLAQAEVTYDQLYPYYVEACAVTQLSKKDGTKGGTGGHAVLYVKGACLDTSKNYPRLRVCNDGEVDLQNPNSGVGISVDKTFKNVNWVAIPGRDMLLKGELGENQNLDQELLTDLAFKVTKYFENIEMHAGTQSSQRPANMSEKTFVALNAADTDFGLNFGRNVYCTKTPLRKEMVGVVVNELNRINASYAETGKPYVWNGMHNNCTHTVWNAIAALGFIDPIKTNLSKLKQIFNLALPSHAFVNLTDIGNNANITDTFAIFLNDKIRTTIEKYNFTWLPTQTGAMVDYIPYHKYNEVYEVGTEGKYGIGIDGGIMLTLTPLFKGKQKTMESMRSEKRYTDLRENLVAFVAKYDHALKNMRTAEQNMAQRVAFFSAGLAYKRTEYVRFHNNYRKMLISKRCEALKKIALIEGTSFNPAFSCIYPEN